MANNDAKIVISAVDQFSGTFKSLQGSLSSAQRGFAALGVSLSAAGMAAFIKSSIDAADSLHDLAIQGQLSVEALSGLKEIGRTSNTGVEQIVGAANKMEKALGGAGKAAKNAVGALGLNFEKLKNEKPEQAMLDIAKAMGTFADGQGKAAVAMALFGKSGAEMLPFLKDLADAGEIHATMTQEQADRADALADSMDKLTGNFDRWQQEIGLAVLPTLGDLIGAFIDVDKQADRLGDNKSVTNWADDTAIALAAIIDIARNASLVFEQVGKSIAVLAHDIVIGAQMGAAFSTGGVLSAGKIYDLWKEYSAFNQAANEDMAKGSDLGFTYYEALKARISARGHENPMDAAYDRYGKKRALGYSGESAPAARAVIKGTDLAAMDEAYLKRLLDQDEKLIEAGRKLLEQQAASIDGLTREAAGFSELTTVQQVSWEIQTGRYQDYDEQSKTELMRLADIIDLKKETARIDRDEADLMKRVNEEQDAAADVVIENIKKQQAEWQKFTDQISTSLTDALMRGFEKGQGFGKNFIDTLQNMFNTLVLRPIISAIVTPIGGAVSAGITGLLSSGSAFASGGGSSGGGGFGSLLSGAQSLWSAFSGGTSAMMESFASSTMGAALGLSSLEGAAAQTAMSMGMMADTLGTLTSAGSALVSAAPFIAGGLAIVGLLAGGGLGGLFGGGHVPRPKAYANTMVSAGSVSTLNSRTVDGADAEWAIKPGLELGKYLQKVTEQIGGEIVKGFVLGTKYMQKYNTLQINVGREITKGGTDFMFDMGKPEEAKGASAATFLLAVKRNLIDVDDYLKRLIKDSPALVSHGTLVLQRIFEIKQLRESLEDLPDIFGRLRDQIDQMKGVRDKPLKLDPLKDAIGNFYNLFYDDAAKFADGSKFVHNKLADLNVAFPASREGFRAMVEGIDTTTTAGLELFRSLVNLSTPMDNYYKALDAQKEATDSATASLKSFLDTLSTDKFKTLFDYNRYKKLALNYGIPFADAHPNPLPSYAVGTDFVPADMTARIHAGERIIPAADNQALIARLKDPQAGNAALLNEVRALRAEVSRLREANTAENQAANLSLFAIRQDINQQTNDGMHISDTNFDGTPQVINVAVVA